MLPVYLTVDTEVSCPLSPAWRENGLAEEIARDIYGRTPLGQFGVGYQIETLDEHGLRANFFLETLFAQAAGERGRRGLGSIVERLAASRHDLQLHLHVEWLERMRPARSGPSRQILAGYSADQQTQLIGEALDSLRAAGGGRPNAFRAGNYAADQGTLRALARHGIRFDTSQNPCHAISFADRRSHGLPLAPWKFQESTHQESAQQESTQQESTHRESTQQDVHEFPVSIFRDWPGHWRPAQLCACSSGEMERALGAAHRGGWPAFVIVWHSFELIKRQKPRPDPIMLRRFRRLCAFLAQHRDRFETRVFSETTAPQAHPAAQPIVSSLWSTAWRCGEQAAMRCL